MGVYVSDTDSELLIEKEQATIAHKQSYCPFVLLKQALKNRREKREEKYRPRIDEIREQINKSREEVKLSNDGSWKDTTSTEERRSIWERGVDRGSVRHNGHKFRTSRKYKITVSGHSNGKETVVYHDFRTPEGREEAFTWWDTAYRGHMRKSARILRHYEAWESLFQDYIKEHDSSLREFLLKTDGKINWLHASVEELSN